jgi:hypothetical protein
VRSAVVCVLTGGAKNRDAATPKLSAVADYVDGVLALGASLDGTIDPNKTHMLLLVRQEEDSHEEPLLSPQDQRRIESVGWTVGTAPNFPLPEEFTPKFPRYKHVYTKLAVVGLEEYDCLLIVDADALVIGDLRDLMRCNQTFTQPHHRLAAGLDFAGDPGRFPASYFGRPPPSNWNDFTI